MTQLPRLIVCAVLLACVCACESEPVEKTVWDDQVKAMDKAREVEDQLAKRAGQLGEDLENYNTTTDEDEDKENPPRR